MKNKMPNDWIVKNLDEVSTVTMGQSPPSSSYNTEGVGVPFLQGKPPVVNAMGAAIPNQWTTEPTRVVEAGTALMTVRAPVGEVFTTDNSVCLGRGLAGIKANNDVSQNYLNYYLEFSKKQFASVSQGSTFTAINSGDLKAIQVALPSYEKQQYFGQVFISIDQEIAKTDQIIQKTGVLKTGLMQRMFSKDKVAKQQKLIELLEFSQYGLSLKSSNDGQTPMFRMNNFENGKVIPYPLVYVDLDDDTLKEYKLEKGDILFNRTNSHELVGKTGIFELDGEYVFASYLVRLRVKKAIIDPYFLNYYMNSPHGKQQIEFLKARGVSQSNINPTALKNKFTCPVPSLQEQHEMVQALQEVDRKLELEKKTKTRLIMLKQGLMNDIFNQKAQAS